MAMKSIESLKSIQPSNLEALCSSIWNEIPELIYDDEHELFDEASGLRIKEQMKVPEPPQLNDVLRWHSTNRRDKYSHFAVSNSKAYFYIYDGEDNDNDKIFWDLSKSRLHEQDPKLIDWLATLI